MTRSCLVLLCLFSFCRPASAQDSLLLTGTMKLSVTRGTMECNLTLKNIPRIADYYIRINSGLNIRYFKNLDYGNLIYFDRSLKDTTATGESAAYYFPANGGRGKFLPNAIQFSYVGAFPVVKDTLREYSVEDWKGNIAFNGYSVRSDGRQSAWYPVLYDIKADKKYDHVRYDIEIDCPDCEALYLNGSKPVKGSKARFTSARPYELTFYAGKYRIESVDGTYFLNPDLTKPQLQDFFLIMNSYKSFLAEKLGIPYSENITFIQTTPTSKDNAWLFVSYPTIVNIGFGEYGMKGFFDPKKGDWFKPYMAHELGHYYFGTYAVFNSELGDMLSEGFSEYLSFKVTRALISDSVYRDKLQTKASRIRSFSPLSFAAVRSHDDYRNREWYVYYYAPLLFLAIEKEIGEEKMWRWLRAILNTKTAFTNYTFLEQTLQGVVENEATMKKLREQYLDSPASLQNVLKTLGFDGPK